MLDNHEHSGSNRVIWLRRGLLWYAICLVYLACGIPLVESVFSRSEMQGPIPVAAVVMTSVFGLFGLFGLASILNAVAIITNSHLVVRDWKRCTKRIPLNDITSVTWERAGVGSSFPTVYVAHTDIATGFQQRTVISWSATGGAARLRDALVEQLGFSEVTEAQRRIRGHEVTIYRRVHAGERTLEEAPRRRRGRPKGEVYRPYRNAHHYVGAIGWPLAILILFGAVSLVLLRRVGGPPIGYLYMQLGGLPFWGLAVWQILKAVNGAIIFTDDALIRRNWLGSKIEIRWDSISAVIQRPGAGSFGGRYRAPYVYVEVRNGTAVVRRIAIAGGTADQQCVRRIRDGIIAIRGFSQTPASRRVVDFSGEEEVWR